MNEQRLRALLRETPIPGADDAERRGLRVVAGALARRTPPSRPRLPRLSVALAATALLAALLLSPAGAAVRDWVDGAFTAGVRDAEPALTEVPGGGRLLVHSPQGSWVVHSDGSRRLLGRYDEATWSPRGLFAVAVAGRTLSAVEPDGTVRWSLSATVPISDPRWSPSGIRIAYRAGRRLRVVAGDGTADRLISRRVAPLAPVWSPQGAHLLAYVGAGGDLHVVNADTGETLGAAQAPAGIRGVAWSPDGSRLLLTTRRALFVRELRVGKLTDQVHQGATRRLPLPAGALIRSASFSPRSATIAVLLELGARADRTRRSEVVLVNPEIGSLRALFRAPGRLSDLTWSPAGRRLLVPWADADQWLFIPTDSRGRVQASGGVAAQFSPGADPGAAVFPRVDGWCC